MFRSSGRHSQSIIAFRNRCSSALIILIGYELIIIISTIRVLLSSLYYYTLRLPVVLNMIFFFFQNPIHFAGYIMLYNERRVYLSTAQTIIYIYAPVVTHEHAHAFKYTHDIIQDVLPRVYSLR